MKLDLSEAIAGNGNVDSFEVMNTKERQKVIINIIIYAGFTLIRNAKQQKKIIDQKKYKLYVY
ncbi:hypothetical protein CN639_25620 [Bacillus toyonensis]|nr:hypothetical protein [Bacillus toyonensis]MCU5395964.1 hypothetical protein [Bacillus toyonensis]PEM82109.1 hypothetical protein CN639_25620 [Bacillus toyonensis]